ncbi:type 1 fimbrial protein [Serratia rubidaea]|nr:type 1 fimbrial protein [Serratia rubidaea]
MKKPFYIPCLLMLFVVRGTLAADSTITITGNVKMNACTVSAESENFTVDLMSHATRELHQVGAVTSAVPFRIVFDKCGGAVSAVKVGFTGTADKDNVTLLKIDTVSNGAAGLGVQILDKNRNAMALNSAQGQMAWMKLTGGAENTLSFYARLMATQLPVTAGTVTATANFTLEFQ